MDDDGASAARPGLATGVWQPGTRSLTVGIVLTITIVAFEALAVATVMPLVERDLGDIGLYGWAFSAFFLGSLVGNTIAGRASDRMSPAIPFAAGLTLFGAGLVVCGAAPSMILVVAGRALQGLGGGSLPAVAYVCVGRGYAPAVRPRMFAVLSSAWVVPSLVGPALAGVVGEATTWRWVFLGLVPLVAVIGVVAVNAVRRLGSPPPGEPQPRTLVLALQVALGGALVVQGLSSEHALAAAGFVAVGFVAGLPAFRRLTPPGTLRVVSGLPAAVALRGVLTFAFFCSDAYVPYALSTVRGLPAAVAGLALTAGAIGWASGSWVQSRYVNRVGPRPLVRIGFVLIASGVTGVLAVVYLGLPAGLGALLWGVTGLGMGTAYSPVAVTVLAEAEAGQEGSATAALHLSDLLGIALGTGTGGALVALGDTAGWSPELGVTATFAVSITVALLGSFAAARLPRTLDEQHQPAVAA